MLIVLVGFACIVSLFESALGIGVPGKNDCGCCTAVTPDCYACQQTCDGVGTDACSLRCGTIVANGWSGQDEGSNACNSCVCNAGMLQCTEMGCVGMECPTVFPPGPGGMPIVGVTPPVADGFGGMPILTTTFPPIMDGVQTPPPIMDGSKPPVPIIAPNPNCPARQPGPQDACTQANLTCYYGQECCCGECYPSYMTYCVLTGWMALHTDACMYPWCEAAPPSAPPVMCAKADKYDRCYEKPCDMSEWSQQHCAATCDYPCDEPSACSEDQWQPAGVHCFSGWEILPDLSNLVEGMIGMPVGSERFCADRGFNNMTYSCMDLVMQLHNHSGDPGLTEHYAERCCPHAYDPHYEPCSADQWVPAGVHCFLGEELLPDMSNLVEGMTGMPVGSERLCAERGANDTTYSCMDLAMHINSSEDPGLMEHYAERCCKQAYEPHHEACSSDHWSPAGVHCFSGKEMLPDMSNVVEGMTGMPVGSERLCAERGHNNMTYSCMDLAMHLHNNSADLGLMDHYSERCCEHHEDDHYEPFPGCPNPSSPEVVAWPGEHCDDPGEIEDPSACEAAGYTYGPYKCGFMLPYLNGTLGNHWGELQSSDKLSYLANCCGAAHNATTCAGAMWKLFSMGPACGYPHDEFGYPNEEYPRSADICATTECMDWVNSFDDDMLKTLREGFSSCDEDDPMLSYMVRFYVTDTARECGYQTKLTPAPLDTCDGAMEKIQNEGNACGYRDEDGRKHALHPRSEESCSSISCRDWVSSIDDSAAATMSETLSACFNIPSVTMGFSMRQMVMSVAMDCGLSTELTPAPLDTCDGAMEQMMNLGPACGNADADGKKDTQYPRSDETCNSEACQRWARSMDNETMTAWSAGFFACEDGNYSYLGQYVPLIVLGTFMDCGIDTSILADPPLPSIPRRRRNSSPRRRRSSRSSRKPTPTRSSRKPTPARSSRKSTPSRSSRKPTPARSSRKPTPRPRSRSTPRRRTPRRREPTWRPLDPTNSTGVETNGTTDGGAYPPSDSPRPLPRPSRRSRRPSPRSRKPSRTSRKPLTSRKRSSRKPPPRTPAPRKATPKGRKSSPRTRSPPKPIPRARSSPRSNSKTRAPRRPALKKRMTGKRGAKRLRRLEGETPIERVEVPAVSVFI